MDTLDPKVYAWILISRSIDHKIKRKNVIFGKDPFEAMGFLFSFNHNLENVTEMWK